MSIRLAANVVWHGNAAQVGFGQKRNGAEQRFRGWRADTRPCQLGV